MFRVTRYPMISKTESGRVGYWKKYRVAGRVRVPAGHCPYPFSKSMTILINTTPVVEFDSFQSGKLFLHLLQSEVDLHDDEVHHVDFEHLEVIQDLHVPIIKSVQF